LSPDRPAMKRLPLSLVMLLFLPLISNAQRDFNLAAATTNPANITVSWKAQSCIPVPGLILIPQFQVERSADLKTWSPVSDMFFPLLGQTVSWTDPQAGVGFYRVASIIRKQYSQLSNAKLSGGQLAGADLFGANLFGASLDDAELAGASLAGADLRSANFHRADLSGADLFGCQALFTSFDSAELDGVDARFGEFESADFFNADLSGADFSFAILSRANMDFAVLKQVTFDENTLIDPKPKLIW